MDRWTQLNLRRPKVSYVIHISEHVHTFWISRFFMCALKLLSSNVACASCLFLFKNHKFHMRQKKDAKTSQNTDVSNVHFLLQSTYETHDHWKCDVAFAWEKPMRSTFFQKTHAFLEFEQFFQKNLNKNAIITRSLHHETLFFTIHLLRAQEAWKHCCQWMKIHIFARLHWEEWSQKRARTRGRSVVVVVVVVVGWLLLVVVGCCCCCCCCCWQECCCGFPAHAR